ncbi:dihydropteroate synthase [Spelaeicoccus albus]|uniref:Inactive dihydropteroate synthase 2 n=1 Tax=Spelaeicoccus albus TaxID=1280376 RepID=A0A7Z0D397_9MICO|nr:dihydropteroate synthase [Spelaeicoccus albus]NYI68079.1 dihydropteroate synthase [Spelaeicoccus albus]
MNANVRPTPLILRGRTFDAGRPAVMAVINRTPDSFYAPARQFAEASVEKSVRLALGDGADIIDIGGVKAGYGEVVSTREELRRVVGAVEWIRGEFPDVIISVDTWRAEVARQVAGAGADVINDTWGGYEPRIRTIAAEHGLGLVCSHAGGLAPRTDPHRVSYGQTTTGVLDDVLKSLGRAARDAADAGVPRTRILLDPTLDFGKNTRHGLTLLRHASRLTELGYPVLMALSRKDFVGETLGLDDPRERLEGTLAATAVAAWQGASVFRTHDVKATRRVVDMVASIRGDRPPDVSIRGLA